MRALIIHRSKSFSLNNEESLNATEESESFSFKVGDVKSYYNPRNFSFVIHVKIEYSESFKSNLKYSVTRELY